MIRALARCARALGRCQQGAMATETAIIAPVLIVLAIGGFEISSVVARQTELQTATAEAAAIVRAALPETADDRNSIRDVLVTSTGLTAQSVTVTEVYRCLNGDDYVGTIGTCADQSTASRYIRVAMNDSYQPIWSKFGFGEPFNLSVSRTIQVG